MGPGTAWGGRLTCNEDIQVGSIPTGSTMAMPTIANAFFILVFIGILSIPRLAVLILASPSYV